MNIANIQFRDGTTEEVRGWDKLSYETVGIVLFTWIEKQETLMYPVDTIADLFTGLKEEA